MADPGPSDVPPYRTRRTPWGRWLLLAACLACAAVLLPCASQIRDGEGWVRSSASLRWIAEAFRAYHRQHGRLPPAVVTDKAGKPLYSWRVLLLPYLEEQTVFEKFRLDEPWDGPHNRKLLEVTPRCYQPALGGDDPPGLTRYQVFVGPGTPFERPGLTWADLPGPPKGTLLAAEAGEPVPWSKPADLPYDPDRPLPPLGAGFTQPVRLLCYEVGRHPGWSACFADGSVRFIRAATGERAVRALVAPPP